MPDTWVQRGLATNFAGAGFPNAISLGWAEDASPVQTAKRPCGSSQARPATRFACALFRARRRRGPPLDCRDDHLRPTLARLLDPKGGGLTLDTLERAASAVGRRVRISFEDVAA
jgi:hypothetical protein